MSAARLSSADQDTLLASALDALQQLLASSHHQDGVGLASVLAPLLASVLSDSGADLPELSRSRKRSFIRVLVDRAGLEISAQALVNAIPSTR